MNKRWFSLLTALMLPVIGMAYLYSRNAEYLSGLHVLVLSALMVLISAAGYGLLRLIFRSDLSAMAGCLAAWVCFFAFGAVAHDLLVGFLTSYNLMLCVYAAATLAVVLLAALSMRRYKGEIVPTLAFMIACVMLLMNGYSALRMGIALAMGSEDGTLYKTEFQTDASSPSPNVYWIHADGMLGFDVVEKYFGDDQREFARELDRRGFMINRSARFEAGHKTALAIPVLMNPHFYDNTLAPLMRDHDSAMQLREDLYFVTHQAKTARINNETRLAFERKGYQTQLISKFGIFFPPNSNRNYIVEGNRAGGAFLLKLEDQERTFQLIDQLSELSDLLIKKSNWVIFSWLTRLQDQFGWDLGIECTPLTYPLTGEQRKALFRNASREAVAENSVMFDALNDAILTEDSPCFTIVTLFAAHNPYRYTEDGQVTAGDQGAIENYHGSHRYAAKLLLDMVDMILLQDPDAVIVIQADHGLHDGAEEITSAFGGDAVLPIWNQVMSAVRVPGEYWNGEEEEILETPLNISRYLMNRFVGEQYPYLDGEGT